MLSFYAFLKEAAERGELVNVLFEERIFQLVGLIDRVVRPLEGAKVDYELIGGMAVFIHVNKVDPTAARNTKDVDLLVNRSDLVRVIEIAEANGFQFRHAVGVDMLLYGGDKKQAVHLVFAGEKTKPEQLEPNPSINPIRESVYGSEVWIIPVEDLLRLKLSVNRLKDQVQIQDMDRTGLITPAMERSLSPLLLRNLQRIREAE
ncbi:MAG: hypothetical protein JO185_23055 [Acidobacteriaceae bacterium]|nr:hypothetical protein [Acidobacteriaceae bacterium]MBV9679234.1 hypothetical protein [Acidobacteriaceae bacterium]